jgi:hypothetical protein
MDLMFAATAVARLLASGAARQAGEEAGSGLVTAIVARVRELFGADARSVDALEQARGGSSVAVSELASALAWYAQRDQAFANELVRWGAQAESRVGGVMQHIHAGRDAYTAGGDQTIYRRADE